MREERVAFFSGGSKLAGILRMPDVGDGPFAGIVQGPGWLGLKDAGIYLPYHQALTTAGFAVLIFDYRGFGESEGAREDLDPAKQLEDLTNAVTYLTTRDYIDPGALGTFGSGGTGGGNAVMLAAHDARIRCAVGQVPVADGRDWLKRMRREYEWYEFLDRLEQDRRVRVLTGEGALVHPREEIMVPTPERRKTNIKADVDARISETVYLQSAEKIMAYKPVAVAPDVSHLMIVGVENDAVTPTDHAIALYEAAAAPKRLVLQGDTTHYAAYKKYGDVVIPEIVGWFTDYLQSGPVRVHETFPVGSGIRIIDDSGGAA